MTRMKRINDRFSLTDSDGESDAYRKFSHQFAQLFNSGDKPRSNEEFDALYVHDEDFEESLAEFRSSQGNMTRFVVGYTGIGKSTTIRYVFSIGISRSPFFNDQTGELVFPTFLDGYQERADGKFNLEQRIRSISSYLKRRFPELEQLLRTTQGKRELYSFFQDNSAYVLEKCNPVDALDWTEEEKIKRQLKEAYHTDPFEYTANELKFLIYKKYDCIKRFIIILDDIETFSDTYQETIIQAYLKLADCMNNTTFPSSSSSDNPYSINLLISMRPHTFRRHIAGRYKKRPIESFAINRPIKKTHPVNIIDLFHKRFIHYTKDITINVRQSWDDCYRELTYLLKRFETLDGKYNGRYMDMIYKLCFYDVRLTLSWYSRIFANRQWVQRGIPKTDAFVVKNTEFVLNNTTVIRALACRENKVFFENSSDIIPNIFYTTNEHDYSILSLMVLRYYYVKTRHDEYGVNPEYETLTQVRKYWRSICGKKTARKVYKVICYLYDIKVLRPSIRNYEDWTVDDGHRAEYLTNDKILYLSPRGFQLFEMLCMDSHLFELIREASFRDYDWGDFNSSSSIELIDDGRHREVFIDLLKYIDYLREQEEDLLYQIKENGKLDEYKSVFGSSSICEHILMGVYNSLRYTGVIRESVSVADYYTIISKKVHSMTLNI